MLVCLFNYTHSDGTHLDKSTFTWCKRLRVIILECVRILVQVTIYRRLDWILVEIAILSDPRSVLVLE